MCLDAADAASPTDGVDGADATVATVVTAAGAATGAADNADLANGCGAIDALLNAHGTVYLHLGDGAGAANPWKGGRTANDDSMQQFLFVKSCNFHR